MSPRRHVGNRTKGSYIPTLNRSEVMLPDAKDLQKKQGTSHASAVESSQIGTIHVFWDSGFSLGVIPEEDQIRLL